MSGDARKEAIEVAMSRVRAIDGERGISPDSLDAIRAVMIELGQNCALFPESDFPLPEGAEDATYRLSEDADGRYALYMNVGQKGQSTAIHDHGTWAVISGVQGDEHNQVWEKIDDAAAPGGWRLRADRSVMVSPGSAVGIMPEELHAIEMRSDGISLHLHLYGVALERQATRTQYDPDTGETKTYALDFTIY